MPFISSSYICQLDCQNNVWVNIMARHKMMTDFSFLEFLWQTPCINQQFFSSFFFLLTHRWNTTSNTLLVKRELLPIVMDWTRYKFIHHQTKFISLDSRVIWFSKYQNFQPRRNNIKNISMILDEIKHTNLNLRLLLNYFYKKTFF